MSTKSTLAYGPTFHLYHEVFDDNNVYLELEGVQFEASYNRIMVPIPLHIWEVIRHYRGIELDWVEQSDEELERYVVEQVDERLAQYATTPPDRRQWLNITGILVFGTADEPRKQQIAHGIAYYKEMRAHQQQVAAGVAELRQANRPNHPYLEL